MFLFQLTKKKIVDILSIALINSHQKNLFINFQIKEKKKNGEFCKMIPNKFK